MGRGGVHAADGADHSTRCQPRCETRETRIAGSLCPALRPGGMAALVMSTPRVPLLCTGDRLTRDEFERRCSAMPVLKKAELVEGVVYMGSPARHQQPERPHALLTGWLTRYEAHTPGLVTRPCRAALRRCTRRSMWAARRPSTTRSGSRCGTDGGATAPGASAADRHARSAVTRSSLQSPRRYMARSTDPQCGGRSAGISLALRRRPHPTARPTRCPTATGPCALCFSPRCAPKNG